MNDGKGILFSRIYKQAGFLHKIIGISFPAFLRNEKNKILL